MKEKENQDNAPQVARMPSEAGSKDEPGKPSHLEAEADDEAKSSKSKSKNSFVSKIESKLDPRSPSVSSAARSSRTRDGTSRATSQVSRSSDDATVTDKKEAAQRVPSKADEPFEQWERDEMENLCNEIRGHLGAHHGISLHFTLMTNLTFVQWFTLIGSLKRKMHLITFYSIRIGEVTYHIAVCTTNGSAGTCQWQFMINLGYIITMSYASCMLY